MRLGCGVSGFGVLGFWAWDEVRGRMVTDFTHAKLKESIVKYYHGDCFGTGQLFQPKNNENYLHISESQGLLLQIPQANPPDFATS